MESKKESIKKSINSGTYFSNVFSIFGETSMSKSFKETTKKLEENLKNIEQDKSNNSEENKSTETKDTEKPENVKTDEPKTEVVVTSTPDEKLLVDTSGLTDKWNKKTISDFNSFLDSIKQIEKYSDNEKENKTIKENFNNLKLIGFKGKLNEYMTCVLYNIKTNIIFELFKRFNKDENTNESEIACFYDVFDFKSTSYKRQSEARQKPNKKERDEYLNQYCYVDFKLLPKEEKLA